MPSSEQSSFYRQGAEKLWAAEVSSLHHGIFTTNGFQIDVVDGPIGVCHLGNFAIVDVDIRSGFVLNFRMMRLRLLGLDGRLSV